MADRTPIKKTVSSTIASLNNFFEGIYFSVKSENAVLDGCTTKLIRQDNGMYFEFSKRQITSQEERQKLMDAKKAPIQFSNDNIEVYFSLNDCKKVDISLWTGAGFTSVSGVLKRFDTNKIIGHEKAFFRAVIPNSVNLSLSEFFETHNLQIGSSTYGSGVFSFEHGSIQYHLYSYFDEKTKDKYFFIESASPCELAEFRSILDEIILALTYLTGVFIGSEIFIVSCAKNDFESNTLLGLSRFFDDLKNGFSALPRLRDQWDVQRAMKNFEVRVVPRVHFNALIKKLFESTIYKRSILLICQAHTEPDYVRSTIYAVALETIANLISEDIDEKIRPVEKKLGRKIQKELKSKLDEYKEDIGETAMKIMSGVIERINSPTNSQKLLAPFEYYKIKLSPNDVEAIKNRNDFLHGRIPDLEDTREFTIINDRLLYCINCLVLKYVGYSGYISYQATWTQIRFDKKPNEYPIRKL